MGPADSDDQRRAWQGAVPDLPRCRAEPPLLLPEPAAGLRPQVAAQQKLLPVPSGRPRLPGERLPSTSHGWHHAHENRRCAGATSRLLPAGCALPQAPGAEVPASFLPLTLEKLAQALADVAAHYKLREVLGVGAGVGGYVLTQLAADNPSVSWREGGV